MYIAITTRKTPRAKNLLYCRDPKIKIIAARRIGSESRFDFSIIVNCGTRRKVANNKTTPPISIGSTWVAI
jgi:hypothetical protein